MREAAEWLVGQEVSCSKLKLRPDACHGCEYNPHGDKQQGLDKELVATHWPNIQVAERLHTAARLGMIRLSDLSEEDFQMLSTYYWTFEAVRMGSAASIVE